MFFVPSFLSKLPVLVLEPSLLLLLFYDVVCGVVVEVRGTSFKAVHGLKLNAIHVVVGQIGSEEGLKRQLFHCLLCLCEPAVVHE